MNAIIRDSAAGAIARWATRGRYLGYPEDAVAYVPTKGHMREPQTESSSSTTPKSNAPHSARNLDDRLSGQREGQDGDWVYISWAEGDTDNSRNWSFGRKMWVMFLIFFMTFVVYGGSSIATTSISGLEDQFGIGLTVGELGLTLYVFAYGFGALFLAPLQDMPAFGRIPVYVISHLLFLVFSIGAAVPNGAPTFLVMRFLAGFFGSPSLATGGASVHDMWDLEMLPYMLALWCMGPGLGPCLVFIPGGFSSAAGWRWPMWIVVWLGAAVLILVTLALPETMATTVLLNRAKSIRKATGNDRITTRGEQEQAHMHFKEIAFDAFARPIRLAFEPMVFFIDLYCALVYSLFYLFFESFPLVFTGIYGFNEGELGLAFSGFVIACPITYVCYSLYVYHYLNPRLLDPTNPAPPEIRLRAAIPGCLLIPTSMMIFGWTSRTSVHWIAPVIGCGLYFPGFFLTFQCLVVYLAEAFPDHSAPILAANDLVRSTMASVFPLFAGAFYRRLGIAGGSSLLAGLSLAMLPGLLLIMVYGGRMRARSKFGAGAVQSEGEEAGKERVPM